MKRIAIIGATPAGLEAARHMAARGFEPHVFEASSDTEDAPAAPVHLRWNTRVERVRLCKRQEDSRWLVVSSTRTGGYRLEHFDGVVMTLNEQEPQSVMLLDMELRQMFQHGRTRRELPGLMLLSKDPSLPTAA